MGIRTTFSGNAQTIDISSIADDMLADVIADHARDRFKTANRANRDIAGTDITYTVSVNGRTVGGGRGEMLFPERQVAVVVRAARGRRHSVVVDWLWEKLQPATLLRVIDAFGEVQSLARFVGILMDPKAALFRFVLTSYLRHRFPVAMARASQVKDLYRYYRMARFAGNLLPGSVANPDVAVLAWIAGELIARSPVVSGEYRDAHMLYADGRPLMPASSVGDTATLPEAREFSFTNTVPYSRKIEIGKTKAGRDFVIQVPNRIFERLAGDAQARFRGIADIRFEMRAVTGGEQTPQRRARRPHNRPSVRFPSIVVTF